MISKNTHLTIRRIRFRGASFPKKRPLTSHAHPHTNSDSAYPQHSM